jgi:hypothetical protein
MATTVRELLESRSVAKKGGKLTASRAFHVYDASAAIQTPSRIISTFGAQGLPAYGEQFPESPNLFARDYDIALVSGHNDLWIVRWEYSELEISGGVAIPEIEPGQPNYVEISASISATRFPIWRSLTEEQLALLTSPTADPVAYPNGDAPTPKDIGGTSVDVNGEPLDQVIGQAEITISEIVPGIPNLSGAYAYLWKRNSTQFLGAPIGQLLYQGVNVNRIGVNLFQYSHKFGLDRMWWMRQVPVRNALGDVIPKDAPIVPQGGGAPYNVAKTVFFVQGFPNKADFFNISPNFRRVE